MNLEYIFYIVLFLIIYTYLIYPVLIKIISFKCHLFPQSGKNFSSASIIISAYNEEKVIEERINNIANQKEINFDNIEVLVGSDGSDDRTNQILSRLNEKYNWLNILLFNERRGKASVINDLVEQASHEILIFTDANTHFKQDAVKKLISGFKNEKIGGISGRLILQDLQSDSKSGIEERNYWEYETFIKKAEGKCGILIGANGGIYAVKKPLFKNLPANRAVTDDFFITLSVLKQDKLFMYEKDSIGIEFVAPDIKSEFNRKIRFSATNFETIKMFVSLLFSKRVLLSFALWSHKIIRWIVPHLFILAFITNILLLQKSKIYQVMIGLQLLILCSSVLFYVFKLFGIKFKLISLINYFNLTNIALFIGFVRFVLRRQSATWKSTPRN